MACSLGFLHHTRWPNSSMSRGFFSFFTAAQRHVQFLGGHVVVYAHLSEHVRK